MTKTMYYLYGNLTRFNCCEWVEFRQIWLKVSKRFPKSMSVCFFFFFLIASGGTLSQNHIMNFLWRPLGWILASESIESGSVWGISPMDCSKVQDYLEKLNLGARTALGAVQCVECRLDCPLRDRHVIPRRPHFQRCLCMTFEPGLQTNFSGRPMFGRWTSMKIL